MTLHDMALHNLDSKLRTAGLKLAGIVLVAGVLFAGSLGAQARMYEVPRSFSLPVESVEQVRSKILPAIDVNRLREEDVARGKVPGPQRFAVAADVSYTLRNSFTLQELDDGTLWRLRIRSQGALSLNLGILKFEMPKGAKIWIYDPARTDVEGPYTERNRNTQGGLWTPIIEGDEIVVEVFAPKGAPAPVIEIGHVNQAYRGFLKSGMNGGSEGACENDVVCPIGDPWRDQIRAVGLYTIGGVDWCTGTLMNNTAVNFTPYVLSANHCSVSVTNAPRIVMYWNYQSAMCGAHSSSTLGDNQTGAIFHASRAGTDFVLFELQDVPNSMFHVYYSGWDASGVAPAMSAGIHHPAADVKAISTSNTAAQSVSISPEQPNPFGYFWRIDWTSGSTEGGSSGSCIFDAATKRCFGQLEGGPSACGVSPTDMHDYYGKLSRSWNGGGSSAERLSDWLDPLNTGAPALDGDPHITTVNNQHYDFQSAGEFVSLRDPDGLEIQTRQTAISTSFTPGADPHDGLATCVSLNAAVAARVGQHRVTYQPNISGRPDPSGMQLRMDGQLVALSGAGLALAGGGRIDPTSSTGGIQVTFADRSVLFVTPLWWADQEKWYLNVDLQRPNAAGGAEQGALPVGGIAGAITADTWLPRMPDGSSLGPMPATMAGRYDTLYKKFAYAWRVTDESSLFDYGPGTSTATFTNRNWPANGGSCVIPQAPTAKPAAPGVAERVCGAIKNKQDHRNCVFDVQATGEEGFAKLYLLSRPARDVRVAQ